MIIDGTTKKPREIKPFNIQMWRVLAYVALHGADVWQSENRVPGVIASVPLSFSFNS